nr:putative ribonuclease H-like domain-containing protein [Tanacetum cinerariifolium]
KSTIGGCQFLGCRLISCQCKKQTVVATSSTEAEYVAAASCCAYILWIQNQLLDYRSSSCMASIQLGSLSVWCILLGKVVKEAVSTQQYVLLPLWSTGSQNSQNTDADVAFDVKENESEVYVSSRFIDLRDEFEEFSINNTNRVNATNAPVTTVGPNPTNITNSFNADSPSDNVVSPNFEIGGKSPFVDPS